MSRVAITIHEQPVDNGDTTTTVTTVTIMVLPWWWRLAALLPWPVTFTFDGNAGKAETVQSVTVGHHGIGEAT